MMLRCVELKRYLLLLKVWEQHTTGILLMQDPTLAGRRGERASPDSRGRGNEETGYWHRERRCERRSVGVELE